MIFKSLISLNFDRVRQRLFYLIVFLIPLNLGKHFILKSSYVGGLLVDYLIPTVWVLDILIAVLLAVDFFFFYKVKTFKRKNRRGPLLPGKGLFLSFEGRPCLFLFLVSVGLSVISADNFYPSIFSYARLVLYVLFFLYVLKEFKFQRDFPKVVSWLGFSVLFLSVLAVFQWLRQGAVFNNYLFFGEQPYSASTPQVAVENVFGVAKIPSYGTFRHPNVFGGFLAVVLVWLLSRLFEMRESGEGRVKEALWLKISFIFGLCALILTFSQIAWVAFLFGLLFLFLINHFGKKGIFLSVSAVFLVLLSGLLLPGIAKLDGFKLKTSISNRVAFEKASLEMIRESPLFGFGFNNFTVAVERYARMGWPLRFPQPVHNIFLLVFAESGIFALLFFILFLGSIILRLARRYPKIPAFLLVSLLQFLILGSFDHYLLTIHQTQILFWLTLGMAVAYT